MSPAMDVADHVDRLDAHGRLLAEHAGAAGLDAPVPTCPGWDVRELVAHTGRTHRWAASYVGTGRTSPPQGDHELEVAPGDGELLDWFRAGHAELVETLRAAPADLDCWSFLPAPSPVAFWARRQAHETAVHAADAAAAAGAGVAVDAVDAGFAADGIDELLRGFFARRRSRLVSETPTALGVRAVDPEGERTWSISVGPDARLVTTGSADGDCVLTGPAARLYLLLWNRGGLDGVDVTGDPAVLDLWREKARVTWS